MDAIKTGFTDNIYYVIRYEGDNTYMDWFGLHTHGNVNVRGTRLEFTPSSGIVITSLDLEQEDFDNVYGMKYEDIYDSLKDNPNQSALIYGDNHNFRSESLQELLEKFTFNNNKYSKIYRPNDEHFTCILNAILQKPYSCKHWKYDDPPVDVSLIPYLNVNYPQLISDMRNGQFSGIFIANKESIAREFAIIFKEKEIICELEKVQEIAKQHNATFQWI